MMLAREASAESEEERGDEEEEAEAVQQEEEEASEENVAEGGREKIRKKYRDLIDEADLVEGDAEDLMGLLEEGDKLFSVVKQTREATLDSQFLELTSHIGAEKVQHLSTGLRQYSVADYIAQVKMQLRPDEVGELDAWESFHDTYVTPYFNRAPRATFLYGALDKEEVVRQARKPKEKEKVDAKVVPKELRQKKKKDTEEESEITRRVTRVFETLNRVSDEGEKPVFWEFIQDPDSFSRTVENLFHFAFLMKDGHAKTLMDETGLPVVEPSDPPDDKDWKDGSAKQWQTVVRLDWALWEKLNDDGVPRLIEPMEDLESEESSEEQPQNSSAKRGRGGRGASQKRARESEDGPASQSSQKRRRM